MKKIGFLSFGHWSPSSQSQTRSAADALLQSIDLAVAAEELGADGAYFRVHHFARQLASPYPLLAAVGARTSRIEIGTAVIDMRYENPLYMAEDAGSADLIAGGRLQLGISRGSPEQVIDGWRYFGYVPQEGKTDADMARTNAEIFLEVLKGQAIGIVDGRLVAAADDLESVYAKVLETFAAGDADIVTVLTALNGSNTTVARLAAHREPAGGLVLAPRREMAWNNSVPSAGPGTEPVVRVHPDDAAAAGLAGATRVTVRSAHGAVTATLWADGNVRPGVVSMTHGHAASSPGQLTSTHDDVDPLTTMPRASGVPVTLEPAPD